MESWQRKLRMGMVGGGEGAFTCTRLPTGHPEGYLEAFATVYCGVVRAIRRHLDDQPMRPEEYDFPTVHDGLRGVRFIAQAVESSRRGAVWVPLRD